MYSVKEIHYTLQGEGAQTGLPVVLLRFAGCNLWSGLERDRLKAVCSFCDTDFVGTDGPNGGKFRTAQELADFVRQLAPEPCDSATVLCTGGEPLLQLDDNLIDALHERGMRIAVETNGTLRVPVGVDWICVSPKASAPLNQREGNELKVVFPQDGLDLDGLSELEFDHHFLQPMDGPELARNTQGAIQYCLDHPRWRLSTQTHKALAIP